jgi:hypothetical protein
MIRTVNYISKHIFEYRQVHGLCRHCWLAAVRCCGFKFKGHAQHNPHERGVCSAARLVPAPSRIKKSEVSFVHHRMLSSTKLQKRKKAHDSVMAAIMQI